MPELRKHLEHQLSLGRRVVALERTRPKRTIPLRVGPILFDGLYCMVRAFDGQGVILSIDGKKEFYIKRRILEGRFKNLSLYPNPVIVEVAHA